MPGEDRARLAGRDLWLHGPLPRPHVDRARPRRVPKRSDGGEQQQRAQRADREKLPASPLPMRLPAPHMAAELRAHVQPGIVKAPTAVFQFDPELGL
jgi:hypothetical protein